MKLPSATAGSGMSCERCGREAGGSKESHFSFCPDCRLFVCDRCWDASGPACEGCVAKRKAEATGAAFLAASEAIMAAPNVEPPEPEPIVPPVPAVLPTPAQEPALLQLASAGPKRGPNGRFLPRAATANGSSPAAPTTKEKPTKGKAAAKGNSSGKAKPPASHGHGQKARRGTSGRGGKKNEAAIVKPTPYRPAPGADPAPPVAAVAFSIPQSTLAAGEATPMVNASTAAGGPVHEAPGTAAATPVATIAQPASPSSEAFRASILNSIGTPDVAWQVMARPGMPAPTRVPVGPARPIAAAPRPVRRTARERLPTAGRLARGLAIRLAMAVILALAALVAIAAAMTLTGSEAGARAPAAPAATTRNLGAAPATSHPSLRAARNYVIQQGDTLRTLARRFYGDEGLWPVLFEANHKRLSAPEDLRIGTEIIVPAR